MHSYKHLKYLNAFEQTQQRVSPNEHDLRTVSLQNTVGRGATASVLALAVAADGVVRIGLLQLRPRMMVIYHHLSDSLI